MTKTDLRSLTREELVGRFQEWSEPAYRADQLLRWLYDQRATAWEAMTNLPKSLRRRLDETWTLDQLALLRQQGQPEATRKFLWRLADHALIESVLIPANPALYGEASDRLTLCVSTQVGCAYRCAFCASGLAGFKRNLGAHEIVEQVLATERLLASERPTVEGTPPPAGPPDRAISNLVIMGMGEPLANYDQLLRALTILNAPWGGGIGARKITVSTSGLAPEIRRLAEEPFQFRLAVSLHGATDAVRDRIMPVNRKYSLRELTAACDYYQSRKDRLITFEYILISGVNDGLEQIRPLADLAHRLHAKVNLIPYNPVEGLEWVASPPPQQEAFLAALERLGVGVTLRREKGADIDAACGQLRLKTEQELATA